MQKMNELHASFIFSWAIKLITVWKETSQRKDIIQKKIFLPW